MDKRTMARRRLQKNRGLEKYIKEINGCYYYQHPVMKARGVKPYSFLRDRDKANATARVCNAEFANASPHVSSILGAMDPAPRHSLAEVIDRFKAGYVKLAEWSEGYKKENFTRLDRIRAHEGKREFAALEVLACKEIIETLFEGDGRRLARLTLIHVYRFAIGEGYSDKLMVNYAEKVNVARQAPRRRERVKDMKEYRKLRAACPDWLQDAMDIALITLQRRSDIVAINRHKDIVKKDGQEFLRFVAKKTGYAVEIPIDDVLRPIVRRCQARAMALGSPFLICRKFRTGGGRPGSHKAHRTQVLPNYLSATYKECTGSQFHELRSLGRREYERMLKGRGMDEEQVKLYIKALGGWDDDEMYELYGETGEVKYVQARAGLKL